MDTASGTPADDRLNPTTDRLRPPITVAEGLQVVIADVPIPPNQSVGLHYHPGEEFVCVLEGSAAHAEPGRPDRAIVFRVQVEGQPDRVWLDDVPCPRSCAAVLTSGARVARLSPLPVAA